MEQQQQQTVKLWFLGRWKVKHLTSDHTSIALKEMVRALKTDTQRESHGSALKEKKGLREGTDSEKWPQASQQATGGTSWRAGI